MRYLLDETPVFCNRTLAKELGLHEALVLQQVNYWIEINKKAGRNFYDGHYWTYNSLKAWQENDFSYMSFDMVRKTFSGLEKSGYLLVGYYNRDGRDRTKWYTINEERLEALFREVEEKKKIAAQEALKNAANIDMPPENIGDCNMQSVENTPFVQNTLQIDRNIANVEKSSSQNIANTTFVKSTNARLENPKCNIAKMQHRKMPSCIVTEISYRDFIQIFLPPFPQLLLLKVTVTEKRGGRTGGKFRNQQYLSRFVSKS